MDKGTGTAKAFAALALCAALGGCAGTPAVMGQKCDTLGNMLAGLSKDARYAYTAQSIDSRHRVHMWYINPESRAWVQLRIYDDLHACVELEGQDWQWALEPAK
jgi:hypothetical protein